MVYGYDGTIHGTQKLNIEVDKTGKVVAVWFRCCALPFNVSVAGEYRAKDMIRMTEDINRRVKLNAVDVNFDDE